MEPTKDIGDHNKVALVVWDETNLPVPYLKILQLFKVTRALSD